MQTITINLAERTYSVLVGEDILAQIPQSIQGDKAFIFVDQNVRDSGQQLAQILQSANWQTTLFEIEATESFKEFQQIYPFYGELIKAGANRHSVIFAIGGGVIGDAIGYIAASYMRGIRWVGIPTTLLAQVDSSIGGKTGVNHQAGKNLIGAFHQPSLVVCDTLFLKTLPQREIIAGLGEVIKYGLIFDEPFYQDIVHNWSSLCQLEAEFLVPVISKCIAWKAKTVEKDELDLSGVREVLNFGHTFGHALEQITHYDYFKHGEAVIWGMMFAVHLSMAKTGLSSEVGANILQFLKQVPLPPLPENLTLEQVLDVMKYDKKAQKQGVRFVLLTAIGQTVSELNITPNDLNRAYRALKD